MVVAYFRSLAEEIRRNMAELGVRSLHRTPRLVRSSRNKIRPRRLLVIPVSKPARVVPQQTPVPESSGVEVEELLQQAHSQATNPTLINNFHRSIGSHLSGERMRLSIKQPGLAASVHEFHALPGKVSRLSFQASA